MTTMEAEFVWVERALAMSDSDVVADLHPDDRGVARPTLTPEGSEDQIRGR